MSKRLDLIKPLWDSIVSSSEEKPYLLCTDLAYASMDLSALRFLRENNKGVEKHMKDARDHLPIKPYFRSSNAFEKQETWQRGINDYNRLSRFYRNQGIDTPPITITYDTPLTPEILKLRILTRRTFREMKRIQGRTSGLSEEEIERELLKEGLSVRCAI